MFQNFINMLNSLYGMFKTYIMTDIELMFICIIIMMFLIIILIPLFKKETPEEIKLKKMLQRRLDYLFPKTETKVTSCEIKTNKQTNLYKIDIWINSNKFDLEETEFICEAKTLDEGLMKIEQLLLCQIERYSSIEQKIIFQKINLEMYDFAFGTDFIDNQFRFFTECCFDRSGKIELEPEIKTRSNSILYSIFSFLFSIFFSNDPDDPDDTDDSTKKYKRLLFTSKLRNSNFEEIKKLDQLSSIYLIKLINQITKFEKKIIQGDFVIKYLIDENCFELTGDYNNLLSHKTEVHIKFVEFEDCTYQLNDLFQHLK